MADRDPWTPEWEGQRPPLDGNVDGIETRFAPSNSISVRHGAYAVLQLTPVAEGIAEQLRELMPHWLPAFEPAVQAAAIAGAQLARANTALEAAADPTALLNLSGDARGWWTKFTAALELLGLTPRSAAALGLTLELARATKTKREQLVERYRNGDTDGDGGDAA
jgi:hypothetical protein